MTFQEIMMTLADIWEYGFMGLAITFFLAVFVIDDISPENSLVKLLRFLIVIIFVPSVIMFFVGAPGIIICIINGWHH